jgi:predicted O-methyltransferase YrrM
MGYLPNSRSSFSSKTFKEYKGYSFKNYVKLINKYPDYHFDIVFVDGRSRVACIKHALKKIKNGGVLILDNSERDEYQSAFKYLKKYKHKDYFGNGPYSDTKWQTTAWFINDGSSRL